MEKIYRLTLLSIFWLSYMCNVGRNANASPIKMLKIQTWMTTLIYCLCAARNHYLRSFVIWRSISLLVSLSLHGKSLCHWRTVFLLLDWTWLEIVWIVTDRLIVECSVAFLGGLLCAWGLRQRYVGQRNAITRQRRRTSKQRRHWLWTRRYLSIRPALLIQPYRRWRDTHNPWT